MMMKTSVLIAALVGSASAFAPTQTSNSRTALKATTAELEGMVGVSAESGYKLFDPLGVAEYAPAEHLRKAELANGRVAMLANVGWFWPKIVGTFDSQDVTTTDPIDAILQSDAQWWAQWILLCGLIEGAKYRAEQEGQSYTGDGPPFLDWARGWDKLDAAGKEDMRLKELKNGRLAMIGFASYVSAHFIPGSVPGLPADYGA